MSNYIRPLYKKQVAQQKIKSAPITFHSSSVQIKDELKLVTNHSYMLKILQLTPTQQDNSMCGFPTDNTALCGNCCLFSVNYLVLNIICSILTYE